LLHDLTTFQAVLSQFSRSRKASDDDNEDKEDEEILKEMEEQEGEEDEEEDEEEDAERDASDDAFVQRVNKELDDGSEVDEHDIPSLTREDINLGRFSIHKVSYLHVLISASLTTIV
jgi:hypothetical protein